MNYQYISTDEMRVLESHAVNKFEIPTMQMMQKAGRAVFDVVMNEVLKQNLDQNILVVAGKGNNSGDALVTAQLLHEKGIHVVVLTPYSVNEFSPMARSEMNIVIELGIPIVRGQNIDCSPTGKVEFSLIIDALFGFSLNGNPRPPVDAIIEQINCSQIPVLSVDVPSGLDVHSGIAGNPTITANYTVALGMPKKGMRRNYDTVGKLFLGDLGMPEQVYQDMKYTVPMFRGKSYISVN